MWRGKTPLTIEKFRNAGNETIQKLSQNWKNRALHYSGTEQKLDSLSEY